MSTNVLFRGAAIAAVAGVSMTLMPPTSQSASAATVGHKIAQTQLTRYEKTEIEAAVAELRSTGSAKVSGPYGTATLVRHGKDVIVEAPAAVSPDGGITSVKSAPLHATLQQSVTCKAAYAAAAIATGIGAAALLSAAAVAAVFGGEVILGFGYTLTVGQATAVAAALGAWSALLALCREYFC